MAESEAQPPEPSSLAEIVAAHVANNTVATTDLPNLISSVGEQLGRLERENAEPARHRHQSVGAQAGYRFLICGQSQKLLGRHLEATHELTADDYRALFDLKPDYWTVTPDDAPRCSKLTM